VATVSTSYVVWMFILVRHGETEWSASGRHTGRSDIPLTATGERQAQALAPWLRSTIGPRRRIVLCSPKRRAVHTAELAGLTPFDLDADLVEWDYGDFDGLTTEQIRSQVPGWTVFTRPCPNGETASHVASRCDRVLTMVLSSVPEDDLVSDPGSGIGKPGSAADPGVAVVLVSHGHLLRVLAARWLGRSVRAAAELELGTAAVCVLGREHGTHTLRGWNLPNPLVPPAGA
jgi:broad specificity phosphatase PhoE